MLIGSHRNLNYLESITVRVDMPDVLERDVHRLSVLELVFKLNALSSHLNADKYTDERCRELINHRMSLKQVLPLKTETNDVQRSS